MAITPFALPTGVVLDIVEAAIASMTVGETWHLEVPIGTEGKGIASYMISRMVGSQQKPPKALLEGNRYVVTAKY